jgi:hypothetical protein
MKRAFLKGGLCLVFIILILYIFTRPGREAFESYVLPKIVWTFWNDYTMPPLIEKITKYNKKNLIGWEYRILHDSTIHNYIPSFPPGYESLSLPAKSDWIRLYLLKKYGGLWMDASIIINDGSAVDALYNESVQKKSQLLAFTLAENSSDVVPKFIESWFLMMPLGSTIIEPWYDEFTRAVNIGFDKYMDELKSQNIDISRVQQVVPGTYLTVFMALQKVLQTIPKQSMIFKKGTDSMYKLQDKCKWEVDCTMREVLEDNRRTPFIKLRGAERNSSVDITSFFD